MRSEANVTAIVTGPAGEAGAACPAPLPSGPLSDVWSRRWLFASVFAATVGLTVAAMFLISPIYSASGAVILGEQEPIAANSSPAWINKLGDPADLESQLLVVQSPRLMRLALARPGVFEAMRQECMTSHRLTILHGLSGREETCAKLKPDNELGVDFAQSRYSMRAVGRSRIISVGYQSTDPHVAEKMANALVSSYLEDQMAEKSRGRQATAQWLWKEVQRVGAELSEMDEQIQGFRRKNNLVRGATATMSSERLTAITQQLALAEAAEAEAAARVNEMRSGDSRASIESQVVARIKQDLASAEAKVSSAAAMLKDKHPALQALVRHKTALESSLKSEIAKVSSGAELAHTAARAKVASLNMQLGELKRAADTAADSEAALASMIRAAETKRTIYNDLARKAGELEAEHRALVGSARLVHFAELPTLPVFPRKLPMLAAGLTLASIFGFAACRLAKAAGR